MTREFTCTYTGELCARGGCTRSYCEVEAEAQGKIAALLNYNVASIDRPAWRGTIKVGRRYRLRNGAIITIKRRQTLTTKRDGSPDVSLEVWVGNVNGSTQVITWQLDGWHAPECGVRPHELDIVATAL